MGKKNIAPTNALEDDISFEQAVIRLEEVAQALEEGETSLSNSVQLYEEGVQLLKLCHGLLQNAERKIELLTGVDAQGNALTQPFDEDETSDLQAKAESRTKHRASRKSAPKDDIDETFDLF